MTIKTNKTNFNTPASSINVAIFTSLVGQFHFSLLGRSLQSPSIKRYFSNNPGNNTLVINSTIDKIVFTNGRAVLMLPPLKSCELMVENITKEKKGKFYNRDDNMHMLLSNDISMFLHRLINSLDSGYYKFETYYYFLDLNNHRNCLSSVYTFDPYNKDCLNLIQASYGYTPFCTIVGSLKDGDRSMYITKIFYCIIQCLNELNEDEIF